MKEKRRSEKWMMRRSFGLSILGMHFNHRTYVDLHPESLGILLQSVLLWNRAAFFKFPRIDSARWSEIFPLTMEIDLKKKKKKKKNLCNVRQEC